jgi:hypothetical protein
MSNYNSLALVFNQERAILKYDAILQIFGVVSNHCGFVLIGRDHRFDEVYLGVIKGVVDVDIVILADCVELKSVGAVGASRETAVLLVHDEFEHEAVGINDLD